jgi:hypothetical protein
VFTYRVVALTPHRAACRNGPDTGRRERLSTVELGLELGYSVQHRVELEFGQVASSVAVAASAAA